MGNNIEKMNSENLYENPLQGKKYFTTKKSIKLVRNDDV